MKTTLILLFAISSIFFFNSCYEPIAGSGVIIEQERNISEFNSVEFDGIGTVHIKQGLLRPIKIVTDDNFVDDIETNLFANTLKIKVSSKIAPTQLDIYVTFEDISQLSIKGSGKIICDSTIEQNSYIWLINSGTGNIELENLNVKNINVTLNETGNIQIKKGSNDYLYLSNYGYGTVNLIGLITRRANVINASYGGTLVNVSSYLNVKITGVGNVWYKGNPQIDSTITGSGKLIKL